jgi:hypothetical protein
MKEQIMKTRLAFRFCATRNASHHSFRWPAFLFLLCCGTVSAQIQPGQSLVSPTPAATQHRTRSTEPNPDYQPITLDGRIKWWFKSTLGPTSLFDGVIVSGFRTALEHPPQWGSGWNGFGRRYALRLSGIGLSNAIEGSAGAAWGEDPRYFRAGRGSFKGRVGHVVSGAFMDRYRDGSYRPAVARFIAIPSSNYIDNSWHPDGERSSKDIGIRVALGFTSKLASNAFKEFWPDVSGRLFHRQ